MSTITTTRLDCGMDLILEPIDGVRSAGMCWLLPGGTAREPEPLEGLGAMWAELVFRGAGDRDARASADALDRLGVSRSADAETFFFRFTGTMLGARVADSLPLYADMIRAPRFDADDIDPVRDLCLQEIEALADDPHERVMLLARQMHAPAPLNRSGMGRPESLRAITPDDLTREWDRTAKPEGAVLAVAGAIEPVEITDRIRSLTADWSGASAEIEPGAPAPRGRRHLDDDTNQVHLAVVHDAPPEPSPDAPPERVIAAVLSGGMSSRLFTEVREKRGLVYTVSAQYGASRDFGRVAAYAGTTPDKARETLDVLLAEMERLTAQGEAGGVTESEFARAVTGIKSSLVMGGESTSARASALARDWFRLGRPRTLDERLADYDRLTLAQVNAYAGRRSLGELTIASIGPAGAL